MSTIQQSVLTQMNIASSKIDQNATVVIRISDRISFISGYIHAKEQLPEGEKIFAISEKVYQGSSLILINSSQLAYGCLLSASNTIDLMNTILPSGYYYVSGVLCEQN